ncbi:hypothetical protein [Rhodococcus sp. NPDC058521]|uniref:hypothetical protein n=1 Tax=Rhodococcus sp. NPDC058521 TaxID=3346536 RepID=UPI00365A5011
MAVSDLTEEATSVVARWNPVGARHLHRTADEVVPDPVQVLGPPRSGKTTLISALQHRAPAEAVEFSEGISGAPREIGVALVVFDAAAAIGREELSILERADASADRVVLALTKIDLHRDWSSVLDRDRRLLAEHAPGFAASPIHPVSASVETSGVEELLRAILSEAKSVPRRSYAAVDIIEQTRQMIVTTAESVRENDPATVLRAERTELLAHRDGRRAERVARMRSESQLAKVELLHEVASWSRAVGATTRTEIARADAKELVAYPRRLADIVADAGRGIGGITDARLDVMQSRLGVEPGDAGSKAGPLVEMPDDPEPRHRGLEDRMTILIGASAGLGLGRLVVSPLAMVPALDIATIPITLLLGALAAWWLTRARGHVAERAHTRQWVADALVHVRAQLDQFVLARLVDAEARAGEAIMAQSRTHALDVDEKVAALDAEIRRTSRRRSGQLSACDRDLAALTAGLVHTDPANAEPNGGPARLIT